MLTTRCNHPLNSIRKFLYVALGCAALGGTAHGQVEQSRPDKPVYGADNANLPDAIAKVGSGEFGAVHLELIAKSHAVQTIPVLEKQFTNSSDPTIKGKIADALVRLGDKNNDYWDFLVKEATPAVESDAPPLVPSDSQQGPSPEFIAWAKAHNVTTDSALGTMYQLSINVLFLAETGDPRGIPLLRRALFAPSFMTQAYAAEGLALAQDKDSIPLIIEACKRSPTASLAIAESLVYFDDPRAQNAVDTYIPKDFAKSLREARAKGKTPFQ
jgi:HEAT repeat protein